MINPLLDALGTNPFMQALGPDFAPKVHYLLEISLLWNLHYRPHDIRSTPLSGGQSGSWDFDTMM